MKESITALIQASSVRKVRWQLILPAGVRITLYRQMQYIHMHVCVRHAIKGSRNVDVELNLSYINKCKIAVRRKTLCGRVRSKKVFLKGNKSSLQHRWAWGVVVQKSCTVAEGAVSARDRDDITVLRAVSLVLKSSYENTEANPENTCEPLKGAFKTAPRTRKQT